MGNNLAGKRPKDFYRDMILVARPADDMNQGVDAVARPLQDGKGEEIPLTVSANPDVGFAFGGNLTVSGPYKIIGLLDCLGNSLPLANDGAASAGTDTNVSRRDHKHPVTPYDLIPGTPVLATVATTGSYFSLIDYPPPAAGAITGVMTVNGGTTALTNSMNGMVIVATAPSTLTLPSGAAVDPLWAVYVYTRGGDVTVNAAAGQTLGGVASVKLRAPSWTSQSRQYTIVRNSASSYEV